LRATAGDIKIDAMAQPKIERSNQRGKFSDEEIKSMIRESRAFWSSPAGQAEQKRLDQRRAARSAPVRSSFETLFDILQ
jgi:hypothetical protein